VSTQVSNEDGTEADLIEHLGSMHQKGTKGYTDEYLASLHHTLHQRKREPQPEHAHPGDESAEEGELTEAGELAEAGEPAVAEA
jgi:hypothetical protein